MENGSKTRRGDLVMVEMRPSYTTSSYEREEITEYKLLTVTNLTRDGRIKMVRDDRYGPGSYVRELHKMLHFTGQYWLLPQAAWDVQRAQEIARAHTYPNSDTPRAWASLEDAREALRPARLTDGGE
jgi:hypothetical protein